MTLRDGVFTWSSLTSSIDSVFSMVNFFVCLLLNLLAGVSSPSESVISSGMTPSETTSSESLAKDCSAEVPLYESCRFLTTLTLPPKLAMRLAFLAKSESTVMVLFFVKKLFSWRS